MPAYKYELKNGKVMWYANFYYTDWTGEKKHVCKRGFATQREAKEFEQQFTHHVARSSDIMFPDLVEKYFEDMGHRLKPTTIATKRSIVDIKITPYFKNLRVCDIDAITIRNWQNELLSFRDENGKPFAQSYLKGINSQLSAIMNYAVRNYGLQTNPCQIAGSMGTLKTNTMQIWTRDEFERFIQHVQDPSKMVAFDVLFYTGIRCGEMFALTKGDILPEHRIRINKNYAFVKGGYVILTPKTEKSIRDVSIPNFLYDELTEYMNGIYGLQENDRLFSFSKQSLVAEMERGAEEAGLKRIRIHDLRHSHASMLINMGTPPLQISERLGHESVKTTLDTYAHLYPNKDMELADELDNLRSR